MVKFERTRQLGRRGNISRKGDSDIFPRPFELDAIIAEWDLVRQELLNKSIESHEWTQPRRVIIPKEKHSYRIATQLNPLDSLIFAAIIHQFGSLIEEKRVSKDDQIVFSHRFSPREDGELYDVAIDWISFWSHSKEMAKSCEVVVMTDITDFYNQIYIHTVDNRLKDAGLPKEGRTQYCL